MRVPQLVVLAVLAGTRTTVTAGDSGQADPKPEASAFPSLASERPDPGESSRGRFKYYVVPRAYPGNTIDPVSRLTALRRMAQMEKAKKRAGRNVSKRSGAADALFEKRRRRHPPSLPSGSCTWISRGPTNRNGRVMSVAIDPNDHTRIFAATVGGLWRSLDRARRWQHVSRDMPFRLFASVIVNPHDGREIYAGGGDPNYHAESEGGGLWLSTNGGDPGSWKRISPPAFDRTIFYRLRIDPSPPGTIYAATSRGVYTITKRRGRYRFSRLGGFDASTSDIAVDFSVTPPVVYAGANRAGTAFGVGIWKRRDGVWEQRNSGIDVSSVGNVALTAAPSAPQILYAMVTRRLASGDLVGVFKSTTGAEPPPGGGEAWMRLTRADLPEACPGGPTCASSHHAVIEVSPANANDVWAGGVGLHRSLDGGQTWRDVSYGEQLLLPFLDRDLLGPVHVDQHAIAFDPADPSTVYVGNDGGIDRAGTLAPFWAWQDVSHNLLITEFYDLSTAWTDASVVAGGTQDNGTMASLGNRTWHMPHGCDSERGTFEGGASVAMYGDCNGLLIQIRNPVFGTPGYPGDVPVEPLFGVRGIPQAVTDPTSAGRALVVGVLDLPDPVWDPHWVFRTSDGLAWQLASAALPENREVRFLAVAPSSSFQRFYLGLNASGLGSWPEIWSTTDGGDHWLVAGKDAGVPEGAPIAAVVDRTDSARSLAVFSGRAGGVVVLTTDGGVTWAPIAGSGGSAFPPTATATDIVLDPDRSDQVYVSTDVGVLRGTITPGAAGGFEAAWEPFNEGLPLGVEVNTIDANPTTGALTIGTMGHGAYERDVTADGCPTRFTFVRDNILDRGYEPSPAGVPDPENPVFDPARPGFLKADDFGLVSYWTSPDIKIDVPRDDPRRNRLDQVDHVEFDTCPSRVGSCPLGSLLDSNPRAGETARVYVQVSSRGAAVAHGLRVIALTTDSAAGLPLLPPDFWKNTFPGPDRPCGPIVGRSEWRLLDPHSPCRTISSLSAEQPEVVRFDWRVPLDAPRHSVILVMVESAEEPLDAGARSRNERRPWVLVPANNRIALRSLWVLDRSRPGVPILQAERMPVHNPAQSASFLELTVSPGGMHRDGRVVVVLPGDAPPEPIAGTPPLEPFKASGDARIMSLFRENGFDPRRAYEVPGRGASFKLGVDPGGSVSLGLVLGSGHGPPNSSSRVDVIARQDGVVVGGGTYVMRLLPDDRFAAEP